MRERESGTGKTRTIVRTALIALLLATNLAWAIAYSSLRRDTVTLVREKSQLEYVFHWNELYVDACLAGERGTR